MNKSEIEELARIIVEIRLHAFQNDDEIAAALTRAFPKVVEQIDKSGYTQVVLFYPFLESLKDCLLTRCKLHAWACYRKGTSEREAGDTLIRTLNEHRDDLALIFEDWYARVSARPTTMMDMDEQGVNGILDSTAWSAAVDHIEVEYDRDYSWLRQYTKGY
jgi:hypothetical protein